MNPAPKAHILIPRAMPLEQFHLQVIKWIKIRKPILDQPREQQIIGKPFLLPGNFGKHVRRALMLRDNPIEHSLAQLLVGNERRITRGHGQIGLGEHHVHI